MKHFKDWEFQCFCGLCGKNIKNMDGNFLEVLDKVREQAGIPFKITSSIRCATHNKRVGGSPFSAHKKGLAVDIACDSGVDRFKIIKAACCYNLNRIGIGKDFVHLDADGSKEQNVIWIY